jgi:hypothetical protein
MRIVSALLSVVSLLFFLVQDVAARHASRSTFGLSRQVKAAIVAGVLFGVFGIAVALDKLWPDSSSKLGAESSPIVKQSVAPSPSTQPRDFQSSQVEPTPPNRNPWGQNVNLPPAPSSPDDGPAFPTTNGAAHPIPIPPCARGQQAERLATGARIEPDGEASGLSELSVSNGTRSDAAVRLVNGSSGSTARFVYIEADHEYTITEIEPGAYTLRFISGGEWVRACRDFLQAEYFEFESALVFKDAIVDNDVEKYNTIRITLNAVPLGTARTRAIDRKRFSEGEDRAVCEFECEKQLSKKVPSSPRPLTAYSGPTFHQDVRTPKFEVPSVAGSFWAISAAISE